MSEEPKIFTKSQLVEKLTEVAKKQKEKNDIVLKQKDSEIETLSNDLNNAISSLNKFKQTQEEILNNVNILSEENKKITEENTNLKNEIKILEEKNKELIESCKDTINNTTEIDKYINFYNSIMKLVKNTDIDLKNDDVNCIDTKSDESEVKEKKTRKSNKNKKSEVNKTNEEESIIEENGIQESASVNDNVLTTQTEDVQTEEILDSEDSIDVDALLSDL